MILKRKLFAKSSIGGEDIYFRDSFFYKNTPQKPEEEKRILKLLKDLDSKGYLNQRGKDYLKTADHRDTIHIASYMLTDEGEDIMERYGDRLEIGSTPLSLNQIDKNGLAPGYKKRPLNLKEKLDKSNQKWEREQKRAEKEVKKERDLYKSLKESNPRIRNLEEIYKNLRKDSIYGWFLSLDETEVPILQDISWTNENRKNKNLYALYSIGGLSIYYDQEKKCFAEEIGYNRGNIQTKPISDPKSRILEYLRANKKKLLQNTYDGLAMWDGVKEIPESDKKAIEAFVNNEIKLIQTKL